MSLDQSTSTQTAVMTNSCASSWGMLAVVTPISVCRTLPQHTSGLVTKHLSIQTDRGMSFEDVCVGHCVSWESVHLSVILFGAFYSGFTGIGKYLAAASWLHVTDSKLRFAM
jgi:hypothetical protein